MVPRIPYQAQSQPGVEIGLTKATLTLTLSRQRERDTWGRCFRVYG